MLKKIVIAGVAAAVTTLGAAGLAYAEPLDSDSINSDNDSSQSVDSDHDSNSLNTDDALDTDSGNEDAPLSGLDLGSLF